MSHSNAFAKQIQVKVHQKELVVLIMQLIDPAWKGCLVLETKNKIQ